MKKVLIISFLIFTILISFCCTSYANIVVTEETLEQAFEEFMKENDNTSSSMTINKENKKITLLINDEEYIMDYDLTNKPTFEIDFSFNSEMSKIEWESESEKEAALMLMFALIADSADIEYMDTLSYMFYAIKEDSKPDISYAEPTNAIEYAKSIYEIIPETINDDLFTWTNKKVSETEDEYNIHTILVINDDVDFSVMDGHYDNTIEGMTDSILSSAYNTAKEHENEIEKTDQLIQNHLNSMSIIQSQLNSMSVNTSKLPQTGDSFTLKDGLQILCSTSFIVLIYIVVKTIKYRK